jgi:hypothetical protein
LGQQSTLRVLHALCRWGQTETSPGVFDFESELEIIRIAAEYGLEVILVASMHACGSNVGDSFKVGIPEFYAKARALVTAFDQKCSYEVILIRNVSMKLKFRCVR